MFIISALLHKVYTTWSTIIESRISQVMQNLRRRVLMVYKYFVTDTIHGRQCMASCFFLLKQFEDVLIYFNSIKSYFYNDDSFNFNYAQAKAANGNYKEAEEVGITL